MVGIEEKTREHDVKRNREFLKGQQHKKAGINSPMTSQGA